MLGVIVHPGSHLTACDLRSTVLVSASALPCSNAASSNGVGAQKRKSSILGRDSRSDLVQPARTRAHQPSMSADDDLEADHDGDVDAVHAAAHEHGDGVSTSVGFSGEEHAMVPAPANAKRAKIRGPRGKRIKLSHSFRKK